MQTAYEIRETIRHCREGGSCGLCAYGAMEREALKTTPQPAKRKICLEFLLDDVLDILTKKGTAPEIVPYEELLRGTGKGWEETWLIGDDEDPERFDLEPCVWIDGHIMLASGSSADADSDHWREQYGRRYGMRVWRGSTEPTEEQRREAAWTDQPIEKADDPAEGKFSGLIAEE